MLLVQDVPANLRILVLGRPPAPTPGIEAEVTRLWDREAVRRGRSLFNGQILSAVHFDAGGVTAHVVEYRWLIAQRLCPELFSALGVRPLAVSGLLVCRDGVALGLRSASVTEAAGIWELVPSGGMDANVPGPDIRAQVQTELREEMGVDPGHLSAVMPFCSIEDTESHVIDIGVRLDAPEMTAEVLRDLHRTRGTQEYEEIRIIPVSELAGMIESLGEGLLPVSRRLLERSGLL